MQVSEDKRRNIEILSEYSERINGRNIYFCKCRCFCGNIFTARKSNISSGHTRSCGCLKHEGGIREDLTGKRFGSLEVLEFHSRDKFGVANWYCRCDCGHKIVVNHSNLVSGNTTSCGCWHESHNMTNTRLYKCWQDMKSRCYYSKDINYHNYGGRGVYVCDEWKNSFLAFKEWSINNGYKDSLTLDRINVDGRYSPSNCRWITKREQALNKRNTIYVDYQGRKIPLISLCRELGMKYKSVFYRFHYLGEKIDDIVKHFNTK